MSVLAREHCRVIEMRDIYKDIVHNRSSYIYQKRVLWATELTLCIRLLENLFCRHPEFHSCIQLHSPITTTFATKIDRTDCTRV